MNNINDAVIGKLIAKLRNGERMSAADLAKELSVSRATISQWESGKKRCSVENLVKLARLFGCTVDEIVNGKLDYEDDDEWLDRNYKIDTSSNAIADLIYGRDERAISEFLKKCIQIRGRFFDVLALKWMSNELSGSESAEFRYLKKYFQFHTEFFGDKYIRPSIQEMMAGTEDESLRESVAGFMKPFMLQGKEVQEWELSKIITFNFNPKLSDILELGFENCNGLALQLCGQQYKDELLARYVERKTVKELTGDPFLGELMKSGAHWVYRWRSPTGAIDEEVFNELEGVIVEDKERTAAWRECLIPGFNAAGRTQVYYYADELLNRKYEDYIKTIDRKTTAHLDGVADARASDPFKYYNDLKREDYDGSMIPPITIQ